MFSVGKSTSVPVRRLPRLVLLLWTPGENLDRLGRTGFPQNCPLGLFGPGVLSSPTRSYLREGVKKSCAD